MKSRRALISEVAEVNPRIPAILLANKDREVDFVPMSKLSEQGHVETNGKRLLGEVSKGYTYFENGDVIVAKITPCMENGKAAYVDRLSTGVAFGSTEFHVLRPGPDLDGRYLFHMIWNPAFRKEAEGSMTGSVGQQRVPARFFDRFEIPLPSRPEQSRIADILNKADAIRRKRQGAVAVTDSLIASQFRVLFGDPVSNSQQRPLVPLSAYGRITTGNTPSRKEADNYGDAIEWIKSDNINTPRHWLTASSERLSVRGLSMARTVPPGSTLVTCIAGSPACVGNAAMTNRTVAFNQQINAISPADPVDPHFLYALVLLSKPLVQRASTESMKGMVSKGKFEQVKVIEVAPPDQAVFGRAFLKILGLLDKQDEAVRAANDCFNSLVQRAFRGDL